ncbi:uncharacterized protein LOC106084832 [Stomoxys calcitrans]|uniref:Uncharacterized protein n=1 Tax=Stomoxys calcitrans TaxID=35570 RepID=A0A1I8NXN9_STOCA|nr:uncharacterized protein LOC106084832 [Stomoxys calcitrans]
MDWLATSVSVLVLLMMAFMPSAHSWSAIPSTPPRRDGRQQRNEVSPYLDLVLCPMRVEPWSCARQQSGRILDAWDNELHAQWQKLKVEADIQLNSTLERRGYSASEMVIKEKPSTILKKIEIGTNYMKEYLAETMDGFLGREYDYVPAYNNYNGLQNDQPSDNNTVDQDDEEEDNEDDSDREEEESENNNNTGSLKNTNFQSSDNTSNGNEFIDIESHDGDNDDVNYDDDSDAETIGQLKKPGNGNKRQKKKKGELASQAANLLIVQPLEHQLAQGQQQHGNQLGGHKIKVKPSKQKRRKRKKKDEDVTTVVVEQEPSTDHFSLGLLDALSDLDVLDGGGKHKKHPTKYGRSNGVTRGKKKKKKKALQKLILLGTFLKAKIELLLKILGAHLQIKFFAIALIGLLINIARFWIDVKRGGVPQKVVYVEHAHHQHHYEDHGEDWNESGGGYWKRSLQTDTPGDEYDSVTDSYQPRPELQQQQQQQPYDAQYLAYRNQWQRK